MFFLSKKNEKVEWKRGEKTVVNHFLKSGGRDVGFTENVIYERRRHSTNIKDALWSICNERLLENRKQNKWNDAIILYQLMEWLLVLEGRSANHIVKKRLYLQLQQYKKQGVSLIIIVVPLEESCEACRALDGKEYSIDEALKEQPLPPEGCTCLRCLCTY